MKHLKHIPAAITVAILLTAAGCSKQASAPAPKKETKTNATLTPTNATNETPADRAWNDFQNALDMPPQPTQWQLRQPSPEELAAYRIRVREQAAIAGEKAREFHTRFPEHPQAADARRLEYECLDAAYRQGHTNVLARLEEIDQARLDTAKTEDERFKVLATRVDRAATSHRLEGIRAVMRELERGARELQKQFPTRPEPFMLLLQATVGLDIETNRRIVADILASNAIPETKEGARVLGRKLDRVGKPFSLQFTALDGREVDVAKMTGKVTLIDFWATWCPPCMAEMPNVKALYEKRHANGFEIIGISLDQDRGALTKFLTAEHISWPQHFDGDGWESRLVQSLDVTSLPSMWLVDKRGILREINAVEELAELVEKLLAEK